VQETALVMHEARALERKVEKGDITPEYLDTGADGLLARRMEGGDPAEPPLLLQSDVQI
jgi:hypothetical protein